MAEEIIPNLYVGDMSDAISWQDFLICVLEVKPANEPANATWIPILESSGASISKLDTAVYVIDNALRIGQKVLVHCGAGAERSPLTVAWYLHKKKEMTLAAAYELLVSKRQAVQNRINWLPEEYRG